MRQYRLPQGGGIGDLVRTEAEVPVPGRGQVLVRLKAASLNYRDLLIVDNAYSARLPDLVPLSDGAGEVVALGDDVTRVAVGDRVAGLFQQTWLGGERGISEDRFVLGGTVQGVLQDYRVFWEEGLVAVPAHLSFQEAACYPCAGVTAWNSLFSSQQPLRLGHTVLVLGSGGVSTFALQFAAAAGARVIATSSSDNKLEVARAMGATDTINYRAVPEWGTEVRRLTDGVGVDHVVEIGGPGTLARSMQSARIGGFVHVVGTLAKGEIDPSAILRGRVNVRGISVGSRQMFEAMNKALAFKQMRPVIDRVFGFEQSAAAYEHLRGASHIGKVVIDFA